MSSAERDLRRLVGSTDLNNLTVSQRALLLGFLAVCDSIDNLARQVSALGGSADDLSGEVSLLLSKLERQAEERS